MQDNRTKYKTILIDPPWPEKGGGKIKRGADRHYPLIKVPDMPRVICQSGVFLPDEDCHLYLWTTNTHLPSGLWLTETLGFRYITCVTWAKPRFGIGQYFRGQTEHLLFAIRGRGLALCRSHGAPRNISTLLQTTSIKKRRHSKKPDEAYELIEAMSPAPRVELFARDTRSGWSSWGNEIPSQTACHQ